MCNCDHHHDIDRELDQLLSTNFSRRNFLRTAAVGGLAGTGLALPGSLFGAEPDGLEEPEGITRDFDGVVRIGYIPITDAAALLVAHSEGYFEDEGLEVADPTLIRGWSPLIESFAANRFNLVHLLKPIPLWMRYQNDFPVKIMSWAHINGSAVVTGRHVEVKDFSDLGGKSVAVPYWYSMHNVVMQMALRDAGLTPVIRDQGAALESHEVNLMLMPPPDMPPALAARSIDAFIVAEPFNAAGEMLAHGNLLRFTGDIWKNHPCCVICMNERLTNREPEWTQKVMNAVVRAQGTIQEDKKAVATLLSRDGKGYLPMPAGVVERAMTNYTNDATYTDSGAIRNADWGNGRIDFSPWPYPSATKYLVSAMNETLVGGDTTFLQDLDPDFVTDDLVNYEFVKKAMEKHTAWHGAPGVNLDSPFEREEVIAL
ncbi:twin-arginine translocation pathway signal [Thioalkalivibrio sp. K90mix]|uniref:ABC transporter substrate-binding protein n=1 Tax=Thioalkalivibrio sp. (strain K90mix) TaxID=396595 RepID=UPI000195A8BF|nr:ABC transporter substrate-binding protein [Thioalkalivibrio sp. K90mix]ADC71482.1 twin-arginine translocation pathway signal [Thioalkalivibrio sp. K90mix]